MMNAQPHAKSLDGEFALSVAMRMIALRLLVVGGAVYLGLCNLMSGNCIERFSRILASPLYICLCVSDPLFIDFDEDGANEPHERVFIREDPHFGCASF